MITREQRAIIMDTRTLVQVWVFVGGGTALAVFDGPQPGNFEILRQAAIWFGSTSMLIIPLFCGLKRCLG